MAFANTVSLPQLKTIETTESVLLQLKTFSEVLYLTGSRFFGGETPLSDYDFFTKDTKEVRIRLKAIGFVSVHDRTYTEFAEGDRLFRKTLHGQVHVDVQLLIGRPENKNQIQQLIKKFVPSFNKLNKMDRRMIWQEFQSVQRYLEMYPR